MGESVSMPIDPMPWLATEVRSGFLRVELRLRIEATQPLQRSMVTRSRESGIDLARLLN